MSKTSNTNIDTGGGKFVGGDDYSITIVETNNNEHLKPKDGSYTPINRKRPFNYNSGTTELLGRDDQLTRLKGFIDQEDPILWWAITGTGGIGKSRLAHEFANRLNQDEWTSRTYTRFSPLTISALNGDYNSTGNNLFIIIDNDAYDFEIVAKWIFAVAENKSTRKIRVLIIQRLSSVVDTENGMAWMKNLLGHNEIIFNCFYSESKSNILLELRPFDDKDDNVLILIAKSFVEKMGYNSEDFEDGMQKAIIDKLKEIDPYYRRPLYLLFLTDAIINKEDIRPYNQEAIMNDVFLRERGRIRGQIEEAFSVNYPRNKLLYDEIELGFAIATVDDAANMKNSIKYAHEHSGISEEDFVAICEQFGLCLNGSYTPIEPDLLGEYYVMRYLHRFGSVLGEKRFWQRFFRDYYRLLNNKYRKGLLNVLAIGNIVTFEFYYKALYEAFFTCDDIQEKEYIKNLLLEFMHICEDEDWKKEYKNSYLAHIPDDSHELYYELARQTFEMTLTPYIEEMLHYMSLVLIGKMYINEVPKLHEYEMSATAFGGVAKEIFSNLKIILAKYESGEEPYDEDSILNTLRNLEKYYIDWKNSDTYGAINYRTEFPRYYARSIKECLFFFQGYSKINKDWLWRFMNEALIRLKEMYKSADDTKVTEVYITTLMIQYEHDRSTCEKKVEIFNELLLLNKAHINDSKWIKDVFEFFFNKYKDIVLLGD